MADYTIPTYPARRVRYYNNQFLKEKDFIEDQAHHLSHARAHLRALCVAGVCEGLTLRVDPTKKLQVAAGTAIDSAGNLIALETEKPGPLADNLADGEYLLHIAFAEEEDVMAPPVAGGAQGNTRWTQKPVLGATKRGTALPATVVVLGGFTVTQAAVVATTTNGRQYSGIRFPGANPAVSARLTNGNVTADGLELAGDLTMRRDVAGGTIGPTLTLMNGVGFPGGSNSGAAIDFNGYDPGGNSPALRLQAAGDNAGSSHLTISMKQPGNIANSLVERLRVTSLGVLQFSNEAPKDKIVIWETSPTDRYGLGINGGNINLFYPTGARFSLRQNSSNGAEVLSVNHAGAATFFGPITPKVGNDASSGIQFPANPGGGGGDEAFLRYSVQTGETTKLTLGINNDADDALVLWQAGAERVTIANNLVRMANSLVVSGAVSWGVNDTRTESRGDAGLQGNAGARSGFYQTETPVNFPPGATSWWHLLDVRHSNPANNFAMQIAGSFFDNNLWFRKTNNVAGGAWRQFIGADATGNVGISGDLALGGKHAFRGTDAWLRLNQDGAFGAGVYTPGLLRVDGDVQLGGKHAFRGTDAWLRLNQDGAFGSGVYTPGLLRVDGDIQLGGGKHAFRGNDTWLRLNQDGAFGSGVYTPGLLRVDGDIQLGGGKHAFRGNDSWLRLNQDGAFASGVYTPGDLRVDANIQVAGNLNCTGEYLNVKGAGAEQAYVGGDGSSNDVQIGSTKAGVQTVAAWNTAGGGWMDVAGRAWLAHSDARSKENIEPVVGALAKIVRLRAVSFDWKGDGARVGGLKELGFVAQEVREVVPEAVVEVRGGSLSLAYSAITALLVEAVQDQQNQIDELRAALKPPQKPKR